ncbi:interleukin-26 [Motacilla alba alba]|uniref:interleukin-26 n=1 Tax=Motacilla alba alba TaxID=1094192 RepID=UPI0018D50AAB|nr:interleukin-26 [Motacilla alba alba]
MFLEQVRHLFMKTSYFSEAQSKKSPTGKHTCRKGLLSQVTENLYVKATSLKSSVPTNCSVRDQLLSFYVKNVFSRLEEGSAKLYFISAFQVLQANMDACSDLVGSVQGGGDPMEPSHFPPDDVTLCCPLITKAAKKQGGHREKCGSSSFCDVPVLGDQGIYKAIHELDILLPWIQAYIQTII